MDAERAADNSYEKQARQLNFWHHAHHYRETISRSMSPSRQQRPPSTAAAEAATTTITTTHRALLVRPSDVLFFVRGLIRHAQREVAVLHLRRQRELVRLAAAGDTVGVLRLCQLPATQVRRSFVRCFPNGTSTLVYVLEYHLGNANQPPTRICCCHTFLHAPRMDVCVSVSVNQSTTTMVFIH